MIINQLVEKSHYLIAEQAFEEAISVLRQSIEIDSNNIEIWNLLSDSLKEVGKHEEAAAAKNRAAKLSSLSNRESNLSHQEINSNTNTNNIEVGEANFLNEYYSSLVRLDREHKNLYRAKEDYQWHKQKQEQAYTFARKNLGSNISIQLDNNIITAHRIDKVLVEKAVANTLDLSKKYQNLLITNKDEDEKITKEANNHIQGIKSNLSNLEKKFNKEKDEIISWESELAADKACLEKAKTNLEKLKDNNLKELMIFLGVVLTSVFIFRNIVAVIIAGIIVIVSRGGAYESIFRKYEKIK